MSESINDPASVMAEIDRLCQALDRAGRELGERIMELAEAELDYGDVYEDALVQLVEDFEGARLPGEDVRRALIHKGHGVRERWHHVRRLQRRVEALEKWSRKTEAELTGRESQLRSLRAEARV